MAAVYVVRTLWGDVEDEFLCFLDPFDSSVLVKTVILYLIYKIKVLLMVMGYLCKRLAWQYFDSDFTLFSHRFCKFLLSLYFCPFLWRW